MDKPITLSAFLAVILGIAVIVTGVMAWGKYIDPELKIIGQLGFFPSSAAFLLCIAWHFWSTRARPDVEPDILSRL